MGALLNPMAGGIEPPARGFSGRRLAVRIVRYWPKADIQIGIFPGI